MVLDHPNLGREEGPVMNVTTIGIDLAQDGSVWHGSRRPRVVVDLRSDVSAVRRLEFIGIRLRGCLVGLESCTAHTTTGRADSKALGHRVRLMSPVL